MSDAEDGVFDPRERALLHVCKGRQDYPRVLGRLSVIAREDGHDWPLNGQSSVRRSVVERVECDRKTGLLALHSQISGERLTCAIVGAKENVHLPPGRDLTASERVMSSRSGPVFLREVTLMRKLAGFIVSDPWIWSWYAGSTRERSNPSTI